MEQDICIQERLVRCESVVWREIAGEHLLVPIHRCASDVESIYVLNEVAGRVWQLLDGQRTVAEIRDIIVSEFEVTPEVAEADVVELLRKLKTISAVRPA